MYDMIVIGGGAAGLSATTYGLEKQLSVLMIAEDFGGKAGNQQQLQGQQGEEVIIGAETSRLFARQVAAHEGVVLRDRALHVVKKADGFAVMTQHHDICEGHTVIVASGAAPIALDVPGAKTLLNHGIGYSITTHTRLLNNKIVAVIGTTARAFMGAAELARVAETIYLVVPHAADLGQPLARALRQMPNVIVITDHAVKAIHGTGAVEQLELELEGKSVFVPVHAVFADLGLLPNNAAVRDIVRLDRGGFIVVNQEQATSVPGIYAAGDVTTTFGENIVVALGAGARAAINAYTYLLAQPAIYEPEPAD
jgi:thioredoxin reductase